MADTTAEVLEAGAEGLEAGALEVLGWMKHGKCLGTVPDGDGPDPYFPPEPSYSPNRVVPESARRLEPVVARLCAGCPVLDRCHDFAVVHPELRGVWGGTLRHQREAERRRINRARKYHEERGQVWPGLQVKGQRPAE